MKGKLQENSNQVQSSYLTKLTVVIPSYNRQNFLVRQSEYWDNSGVKIIVLDGSITEIDPVNLNKLKRNKDLIYIYSNKSLNSRLFMAKEMIQTPYVVTLSDDDFLIKSSANKAIEILEFDSEIVACRGQQLHAQLSKDLKNVYFSDLHNHYHNFQVNHDSLNGRLGYVFNRYNPATCFAVLRSDVWKASWGSFDYNYSTTNVNELLQTIITYSYGKLASINLPYIVGTNENFAINTTSDNRSLLISEWWQEDQFQIEKKHFMSTLESHISRSQRELDKVQVSSIKIIIDNWINSKDKSNYLGKIVSPKIFNTKSIMFLRKILTFIFGRRFYEYIRIKFIEFKINAKFVPVDQLQNLLHKASIEITQDIVLEINSIHESLINFHRK